MQAENWATFTDTVKEHNGQVNTLEMIQYVGAVDHKAHFALDLSFGKLRLAYLQPQDLTQVDDLQRLRIQMAAETNNDPALLKQLKQVYQLILQSFPDTTLANWVVVTKVGASEKSVTELVKNNGGVFNATTRFLFDGQNIVEISKSQEVPVRPRLLIGNGALTEQGNPARLYGVVMPHFQFGDFEKDRHWRLYYPDLMRLRKAGGNFVRIGFNATFIHNRWYAEGLVNAVEVAHEQGFRVMLSLSQEGKFIWPSQTDLHVIIDSGEELKDYWAYLLEDKGFNARLSRCVDIFTPVEEPLKGENIHFTWAQWGKIVLPVVDYLREKINRSDGTIPLCAISGTNWSSRLPGATSLLDRSDLIYKLNAYYLATVNEGEGSVNGIKNTILAYRESGIPVIIGEYAYGYHGVSPQTEIKFNEELIADVILGLSVPALRYAWMSRGDSWQLTLDGKIQKNADNWIDTLQGMDG